MSKEGTRQLGADIPIEIVDRFNAWCVRTKRTRTGSIIAALEMLQRMPVQIRELAMEGRWDEFRDWFELADALVLKRQIEKRLSNAEQSHPSPTHAPRRKAGSEKP